MFKNTITQTPLTTVEANEYFTNITGDSFRRDVTFLTSLRALLANRMPAGESLHLSFSSTSYTAEQLSNIPHDVANNAIVSSFVRQSNIMRIHMFTGSDESNNAWLDWSAANFERMNAGWHMVEKVSLFFRKVFRVQCFINPELKSVALITENLDIRRLHYLQCGIFAFLPWYFDQETGVSDDEMALIKSLREKTSDEYEFCVEKIASQYDFKTARVKKLLAGFETKYERARCEDVQNRIRNILRRIESLNDQISGLLTEKGDAEIELLGLETKIASGSSDDSEIMDYFLTNKHLTLKSVDGTEMEFIVRATLDYFDSDMAERCLNNQNSYFYDYCGDHPEDISRDDMKLLMKSIFMDELLKIQFCAAYRFDIRGGVTAMSGYNYGSDGGSCMSNPHIDGYSCMGNYRQIINERLTEHDYIGALEQCIASCKSLNFGDSTVMRDFMQRITGRVSKPNRCIILPDGNVVRPKQAIEWLKAQEAPVEEEV